MTVLPEERCHTVKNMADPLFLLISADQYTSSGEIVGNGLVLAPLEKERSRNERDIIEFRLAYGSRRSHNLVGKSQLFHVTSWYVASVSSRPVPYARR